MAAVDMGNISKMIERLISENTTGYEIERNKNRNEDPQRASIDKGLIQIFRGDRKYNSHTTGNRPFLVEVNPMVEIQYASFHSSEEVEDRLTDAEDEILDILNGDKTLIGSVAQVVGYEINDMIHEDDPEGLYYQAIRITINAEVRA